MLLQGRNHPGTAWPIRLLRISNNRLPSSHGFGPGESNPNVVEFLNKFRPNILYLQRMRLGEPLPRLLMGNSVQKSNVSWPTVWQSVVEAMQSWICLGACRSPFYVDRQAFLTMASSSARAFPPVPPRSPSHRDPSPTNPSHRSPHQPLVEEPFRYTVAWMRPALTAAARNSPRHAYR